MSASDDLLAIAETLARLEPGRPKDASLKRAESTAYYAVFHALAELCCNQLVGWSARWPGRAAITRSLEHSSAVRLASISSKHELFEPEFLEIGTAFLELQRNRHVADYDPRPLQHGRAAVLARIDSAREAVRKTRLLSPAARTRLAVFLIARSSR